MPGSQTLYKRHRQWALSFAERRGDSDEDRLVALITLARCTSEYGGSQVGFKSYARPRIEEALHREAVKT